jgi:hypothetical protein
VSRQTKQQPNADAWEQLDELYRKFTRRWEVRTDLKVTARATDRTVELGLAEPLLKLHEMRRWHVTTRNVVTMRDLAKCLNAACDFVENANPKWASFGPDVVAIGEPNDFLVAPKEKKQ